MKAFARFVLAVLVVTAVAVVMVPRRSAATTIVLDPSSSSLTTIPATAGDLLRPAAPAPGPLAAPVVAGTAAALGLLPGDVIDAISYFDDGPPPGPGTLYFSVSRPSLGAGAGPFTPDVFSEVAAGMPIIQPEASSDIFSVFDPTCGVGPGTNTQVLDGDGFLLAPGPGPTCYGVFGQGLAETNPLPGPPLNDAISGFDWAFPGKALLSCVYFSLAPGSPTLTPLSNPLFPAGAGPGDVLVACPGPPPFIGLVFPAAGLGLVAGPPGCAPPVCDDIDALALGGATLFSLSPASPSVIGPPFFSAADVLSPGPAVAAPAGVLGLAVGDNVIALESVANPCPVAPFVDPDGDGVDNFCGTPDNCPGAFNIDQQDSDGDGFGDACDPCTDIDADGFGNPGFPNICATDNCPFNPNAGQDDGDADGRGNLCDNCQMVGNAAQTDLNFNGIGDVCECPTLTFTTPQTMAGKEGKLGYKGTGPGGGDDAPKLAAHTFISLNAFDPDSTHNVRITLRNSTTSANMFSANLAAGGPLWTQSDPTKKKWKYKDSLVTTGIKGAELKELSPGSDLYQFKMGGKDTNIAGPLAPADNLVVILELESGGSGSCFVTELGTCKNKTSGDSCKP